MLAKYKEDKRIYEIYGVRILDDEDVEFYICTHEKKVWMWIDSREFEPYRR